MTEENYTRKNRIAEAMTMRGMRQVELVEKTGIKKSSINNWLGQRWQPKQAAIMKMAKALDVSEMWLAGYDVPMERPIEQVKMDELAAFINILRKDERLKNLFISMSRLNPDQLNTIENMVNELIKVNSHLSKADSE